MATKSSFESNQNNIQNAEGLRFGIVVSDWNKDITTKLLTVVKQTLVDASVSKDNLIIYHVPGSFELVYGAKILGNKFKLSQKNIGHHGRILDKSCKIDITLKQLAFQYSPLGGE